MNAIELVNQHHAPIPWVVDGLFRPGFTCLAGSQSSGKTTLMANMAVDIPEGRALFGHYAVPEPRPVIIWATEGTARDLAQHIETQCRSRQIALNPKLHIYVDPPPANSEGLEMLEGLVNDLKPGVVFIDLFDDFETIRQTYHPARAQFRTWNMRGLQWNCALIGTMHAWRGGIPATGEWMSKVFGSQGALGAMVVRTGLARIEGTNRSVLRVTGKGTQNHDLELEFDAATQMFKAVDASGDQAKPDTMGIQRRLILEVVAAQDPPGISATEIAPQVQKLAIGRREPVDYSKLTYDNLRQMMWQMAKKSDVPLVNRDGVYYTSDQLAKLAERATAEAAATEATEHEVSTA